MKKNIFIILLFFVFNIFSQNLKFDYKYQFNKDIPLNTNILKTETLEEKSGFLAFLYSFLLPGMGELYLDRYDVGQYFTVADGSFWLVLAGFNYYAGWQKDNYKNHASANALVNNDGKSEDFYADVSSYLSVYDFNQEKYLNREYDKVYNTSTHFWQWETNEKRKEYRSMWKSSEQSFINTSFIIAGLVLNRIISGINAAIMAGNYNAALNSNQIKINSNFEFNPNLNSHFIKINFQKSF